MELVFDQKGTRLYYHPEHKVLHLKWSGIDDSDLYLEVLKSFRTLTIELGITGWLTDLSEGKTMPTLTMKVYLEFLWSALTEGHLKKYARVVSQDEQYEKSIMVKLAALNKDYNLGIEIESFKTEAEALAWLFNASPGTLINYE